MTLLQGDKVLLRPLTEEDAEKMFEYLQDVEIPVKSGIKIPENMEESLDDIKIINAEMEHRLNHAFAITIQNEFAGRISLFNINCEDNDAETGFWIARKYWNNGYGTEALKIITDYAFTNLKLTRLKACVKKNNRSSARVLEKNGFKITQQNKREICYEKDNC